MRGVTSRSASAVAMTAFVHASSVAQEVPGVGPLMRESDALALPSIGRIVLALFVTICVGIAAVLVLRRFQQRFGVKAPGVGVIHVIEKVHMGTFRVYLLSVQGSRVLLTEKGNAISMTVLPSPSTDASANS